LTHFVDANVVVYAAVAWAYREPLLALLEAIARGDAPGRTSTAALEEASWIEHSGCAGNLTASPSGPTRSPRRCSRSPTTRFGTPSRKGSYVRCHNLT
jgi:hypothetical protein